MSLLMTNGSAQAQENCPKIVTFDWGATLNITSLNLTYLFGGVVVIEQVFAFPGFGALLVGSLMQLDIPLIQATVLIAAAIYIFGNLLADIGAILLNPRLRHAS